ncbi:hypothetical protein [Undibacterium sp. Tian12W]|uniref:hypothetical protein n=1 Tax=Undibacterium sp. Tian12W TaxID=3413054 RepID=UPI003BF12E84
MEYVLKPDDFVHIPFLRELIMESAENSPDLLDLRYQLIGDILLENLKNINIDEDILNLMRFSVGLTSEVSPLLLSRGSLGAAHWSWRPVCLKVSGINSARSDVRPIEKQVAAMVNGLTMQLQRDPEYEPGARALFQYVRENSLWSRSDEPDIEF